MNTGLGHTELAFDPGINLPTSNTTFTAMPEATLAPVTKSGAEIGEVLAQTGALRDTEVLPTSTKQVVNLKPSIDYAPSTPVALAGIPQALAKPEAVLLNSQVETKVTALRQALSKFGPAERHLLTHMKENSPKALLLKTLFLLPVAWMLVLQMFNRKPSQEAQSNMANAAKALGELTVVLKSELDQSMNANFIRTVLTETDAPSNRNATKAALATEIKAAYTEVPGTDLEAFINRATTGDLKPQIINHVFNSLISDRLGVESAVEAKAKPLTGMNLQEAFRLVNRFITVQERLTKESGTFSRFLDPMRGVYDKVVKVFKDSQDGMQTQLLKGIQGLSGDVSTAVQQVAKAVGESAPGVIRQAADALGEAASAAQRRNSSGSTLQQ